MIDPTKTTPEKLAEMNDSLIVDNNYLQGRVKELEAELAAVPLPNYYTQPALRDGEPCNHPGCLSHVSHPCEGCGRVAGLTPNDTGNGPSA